MAFDVTVVGIKSAPSSLLYFTLRTADNREPDVAFFGAVEPTVNSGGLAPGEATRAG